jgi:hypothetical protein
MIENKKWFSSLTPLSHKEYVTFADDKNSSLTPLSHKEYVTFGYDKKGNVLGTGVI